MKSGSLMLNQVPGLENEKTQENKHLNMGNCSTGNSKYRNNRGPSVAGGAWGHLPGWVCAHLKEPEDGKVWPGLSPGIRRRRPRSQSRFFKHSARLCSSNPSRFAVCASGYWRKGEGGVWRRVYATLVLQKVWPTIVRDYICGKAVSVSIYCLFLLAFVWLTNQNPFCQSLKMFKQGSHHF